MSWRTRFTPTLRWHRGDGPVSTGRVVIWQQLLDECSRLHTTRWRPGLPLSMTPVGHVVPYREDARVMSVTISGMPGRIVPTGLHEPGFYAMTRDWRFTWRSERELVVLRHLADTHRIRRAEDP